MNGAISAWIIAAPAGGAVLAALSIFAGGAGLWVRRVAAGLGFGVGTLAAVESFFRLRHAGFMTSNLGGWAPPWGVELRLDACTSWMLLGLYLAVWIASRRKGVEEESRARALSLRLLFLSGAAASLLLQDALSLSGSIFLASLALAGLFMDDTQSIPAEGVRPPFDFLIRTAVGQSVVLAGAGFLFARTGTFDLGGWKARLASAQAVPEVGAAFLLLVFGFWIIAGAWPSVGWQGAAWADSPAVVPERLWFSRLVFVLAAHMAQHVAVSPSGLSAIRLWDATRWVAWAAFVVCTVGCLSTKDRRKAWGFLDASGLFLMWALSDASSSVVAALAVSQALGLTLVALAPSSQRQSGVWTLKLLSAILLPGWWIFSVPGGSEVLKGSWGVGAALLWLSITVLRVAKPLQNEEAASAVSEQGFMTLGVVTLGVWVLALLLG